MKVRFCNRLGANWADLANPVGGPPHERDRFRAGHEAQEVWEWLERQDRLPELPDHLDAIRRPDLAEAIREELRRRTSDSPVLTIEVRVGVSIRFRDHRGRACWLTW